ncbi:MAG TPA: PH domain-containing protein [bacterium]|nr:PH domain-containing protein [bacterium]
MIDTTSKKLFPSQTQGERVFLLLRKHWFNYIVFAFLDLLALIPTIGVVYYWTQNYNTILPETEIGLVIGLAVFWLIILGIQLYGFVDYYLDVDIVTDQRIVDITQNGLFRRNISELHLHQVQDVSAHVDGVFQTLLHFGDVLIQTAGERENFVFRAIPHPYRIAKQILDLHQQHIERKRRAEKGGAGAGGESEKNQFEHDRLEAPIDTRHRNNESDDPTPFSSSSGGGNVSERREKKSFGSGLDLRSPDSLQGSENDNGGGESDNLR